MLSISVKTTEPNAGRSGWASRVRSRTRSALSGSFHGVSSVTQSVAHTVSSSLGGATGGESTSQGPLGLFGRTSHELRASLSSRSGSESPVFDSSQSTESCPASVLATSSSIDSGSPTPDPNTRSTRFSWRKKPLDLLKMVEGHFTIDDTEAAGSTSPWEVIQMSNSSSPSPYPETPTDLPLPEMIGSSEILSDNHRRYVCKHLPARAEGYTWNLLYSTTKHGFSLKSLYREMAKVDSPVLLVIEDTVGSIFGALTSCPLKTSDLFYGTGETFLFLFDADGEFLKFPWTGDNMYFIKGNQDSLVIGSGDGTFGLWLDEDLCHGRTQPCRTFANPRLAKQEDFVVKTLECWGFV